MRAAVFDVGGVLLEWDAPRLFRSVLGDDDAVARFMAEVRFAEWNTTLDRGEPFATSVAALGERYPEWAAVIDAFGTRWSECIGPAYADALALIADLRDAGVPCFALSNSSVEALGQNQLAMEVFSQLDGVLLSGEIGVCKPDPEIYAEAERRFGLHPATTWFTDDNASNVAAAVARGWSGHVCTDPSELRAAATAAGLLSAPSTSD
ncbi:MAG TPA: HAD-IA family hydrolase [Acidimicrobiales bacterium]|nr:HAD-IA family hydrolase [Acidimicrobiales bacterium]